MNHSIDFFIFFRLVLPTALTKYALKVELLLVGLSVLISFGATLIAIPPIVRVAEKKHLFDVPDERKIHDRVVPPLGGVAIFLGFVLASIIATDGLSFDILKYIIASVFLVFFIGLKDDLIAISPRKKFGLPRQLLPLRIPERRPLWVRDHG